MARMRLSSRGLRNSVVAAALAAGFAMSGIAGAQAAPCKADKFINSVGSDLFSAAKSGSQSSFKRVVDRYADKHTIGQFALGRYRKQLPSRDASNYADLVASFVANLMAENAKQFQGSHFEITRCPSKGNQTSVTSKLHSDVHGVRPVIFRLSHRGSGYKILDVNVHGIWLGVSLRQKVNSVLKKHKGDFNKLYAFLAPKRLALKPVGGQ